MIEFNFDENIMFSADFFVLIFFIGITFGNIVIDYGKLGNEPVRRGDIIVLMVGVIILFLVMKQGNGVINLGNIFGTAQKTAQKTNHTSELLSDEETNSARK